MAFAHLHVHTEYSLLDSACRIDDLLDTVSLLGQSSVAITDHAVMHGAAEFYRKAVKRGINPVIGCEVYLSLRSRFESTASPAVSSSHLVLLCENDTGYRNLIDLVSKSYTEGGASRTPIVDLELLRTHSKGLIALSGCPHGEISRRILNGNRDGAGKFAVKLLDIFGEGNFYLELQNHGLEDELKIIAGLRRISRETGVPLVCTNDVHYVKKEQAENRRVLRCIASGRTVDEGAPDDFETDEYYLKSEREMLELFGSEAVESAAKIAGRCRVTLEFGRPRLPVFDAGGRDHFELLRGMSAAGAARLYGGVVDGTVSNRLNYELGVIKNMGYVDYFLIVQDFVNFAKRNGIPVGPGRGSGAGSLVAYCIGITGIDPLKYDLLFERFLNPERVSMPDFDIDFCFLRRQEVIDYVTRRYGVSHVAQIVTFGTMAARAAVRDVGRALGIEYRVCDRIARMIPAGPNVTINGVMEGSKEMRDACDEDPDVKRLIDTARQIEGMPRHSSVHPAGVVITDRPVSDYVPLFTEDGARITQYQATDLEELGLLKIDFLGLRTVTVIDSTVKRVRESGVDISANTLPQNDPETFNMLASGYTDGVFQFESPGMRNLLRRFSPDCIEDLIALISLFRPGPMDSIPRFIHNHRHPEDITYETELLRPILSVTYGCIVYQEQVMRIFRDLAGYSLGRADAVRRAMAKKRKGELEKERHAFVYGDGTCVGCAGNGISPEIGERLFDEMSAFGSYAYNKSHATAYAVVAYQTAYLKTHYPAEFMASLLTLTVNRFQKLARYIDECARLGIKMLPPHVNKSEAEFTVSGGCVRFGFAAVKSLGEAAAGQIISEREKNGDYRSLYDFCERHPGTQISRRAVENLILCGAFDGLGYNRREMMSALDEIMNAAAVNGAARRSAQISLFGEDAGGTVKPEISHMPEMPRAELLKAEKEVTGLYLSGHPMAEYAAYAERRGAVRIADITDGDDGRYDGKTVKVIAIVNDVERRTTKSERIMANVEIEDTSGSVIGVVFPDCLRKYGDIFTESSVLEITGKVMTQEGRDPQIIVENVSGVPPEAAEKHVKEGLYLKVPDLCGELFGDIKALLRQSPGKTPVVFVCAADGKRYAASGSLYVNREKTNYSALKKRLGDENVKLV